MAAKANAKAAAGGKTKAQAQGWGGGRDVPKGALLPAWPPPVTTRGWVHCGWDADCYVGGYTIMGGYRSVKGDPK